MINNEDRFYNALTDVLMFETVKEFEGYIENELRDNTQNPGVDLERIIKDKDIYIESLELDTRNYFKKNGIRRTLGIACHVLIFDSERSEDSSEYNIFISFCPSSRPEIKIDSIAIVTKNGSSLKKIYSKK